MEPPGSGVSWGKGVQEILNLNVQNCGGMYRNTMGSIDDDGDGDGTGESLKNMQFQNYVRDVSDHALLRCQKGKMRRGGMNRRNQKCIKIVYSNIQGFTGKKTSLHDIMDTVDCDICMLAETMTLNVKMEGLKCIKSNKSVGQNVAIILRGKLQGANVMKLYEPNDVINMLGIRIELAKHNFKRMYTAHMKQAPVGRDEIRNQFNEIKAQFHQANINKEGMILIGDVNVHVGSIIPGCKDSQDWCGAEFLDIIKECGLHLLNSSDMCKGVVTRVDPRNGSTSTIDLAICNNFMLHEVVDMYIDEEENYKPTKYTKNKVTKTDHNTIIVKLVSSKVALVKGKSFLKVKDECSRKLFVEKINKTQFGDIFLQPGSINTQFKRFKHKWDDIVNTSFARVTHSNKTMGGVDSEVKELMIIERLVKSKVKDGELDEEMLAALQNDIADKIETNLRDRMMEQIDNVVNSKCPEAEVFKVRRHFNNNVVTDFPLRDDEGNVQVTKEGLDGVINKHFTKVFQQNAVRNGWEEYWEVVQNVYERISVLENEKPKEGPTYGEIRKIIQELDPKKSVYGNMSIDLLKLGGENLHKVIHQCVYACFMSCEIPEEFRIEKMILLYKHKGSLDNLDNYRGIFLRIVILSIYQKWLYSKCAPIVDEQGSNVALGGRKGKSGNEALLIVKLIQDHARWTKQQFIFKFLDIEKFFDSMNFERVLIDIYLSGVNGQYWKAYENINREKLCVPFIPSGRCSSIDVENVFVQGSSDAVLMAWNHMDTLNKKERDVFSKNCIVEGVDLDAVTFVDDIFGVCKSQLDVVLSSARDETFQDSARLKFKPPKCKLLIMNACESIEDDIMGFQLEIVNQHVYLGTIISDDGKRNEEIHARIMGAKSVSNELTQILRSTELSVVRLKYVKLLSGACLDSKVKYGCAVWNSLNGKQKEKINAVKLDMIKNILEMPKSTPSIAIQYEFGVVDLDLEVCMEKVLLGVCMLGKSDSVGAMLLRPMLEKKVPGFCLELLLCAQMFEIDVNDPKVSEKSSSGLREFIKEKIVSIQSDRTFASMCLASKTDLMLNNFKFESSPKKYLLQLPFRLARIVFMFRCRMFPTKNNFKDRWGSECRYCHQEENDLHLFACPGYMDLLNGIRYDWFVNFECSLEELAVGAEALIRVKDRLEICNKTNAECGLG